MNTRYVIAGGPGIGKSTLIEILASRGYAIIPETARIVIEEEKIKKSDALPWKDVQRFQELVAKRQIRTERESKAEVAFLDRGVIDGVAYCKLAGVLVPKILLEHLKKAPRYDKVFILDPLPAYDKNDVRWEPQDVQIKTHKMIVDTYKKFGYKTIAVPVLPPEKRADFIIKAIGSKIG